MRQMVAALFHPDADAALLARVEERMLDNSPAFAASLTESLAAYDLSSAAAAVSVPIRCINGDLYPTDVEKGRTVHRDFDAVVLPHSGHYPMLERPELFNRQLAKLLETFTTR